MLKNATLLCAVCASLLFAQPASTIDTVLVTPVFLKLVDNTNNVYKYVGKVSYELVGWSNDRFNASLSIIQDGSGTVVPLTSVKGDGYGSFNYGGMRGIFLHLSIQRRSLRHLQSKGERDRLAERHRRIYFRKDCGAFQLRQADHHKWR